MATKLKQFVVTYGGGVIFVGAGLIVCALFYTYYAVTPKIVEHALNDVRLNMIKVTLVMNRSSEGYPARLEDLDEESVKEYFVDQAGRPLIYKASEDRQSFTISSASGKLIYSGDPLKEHKTNH